MAFALITGMRYGWGVDYLWYKYQFDNAFTTFDWQVIEQNKGFLLLNKALNTLGFNYVAAFIFYSFVFVPCAFVLIRSYGAYSKYMYALLIPACIYSVTWSIRQGFSFNFVFLALYFLHNKKWLGVAASVFLAATIHGGNIIIMATIALCYLFANKKPFDWKATIPIYLFFVFFPDVTKTRINIIVDYIVGIVGKVSLGDSKFQSYIDRSDMWLSEDAAHLEWQQGFYALMLDTLFYCSIIYLGYRALKQKNNPTITYLYNTMVLGIIFFRAVFYFEILRRIAGPLMSLYFLVLGYSIAAVSQELKKTIHKKTVNAGLYYLPLGFILLYLFLYWGRWIFFNDMPGFIWS